MNDNDVVTIDIIPSKSFAHRAYICDFLAGGNGESVICDLDSDDIRATRNCLDSLWTGDSVLDVAESGSTLRFMLPLVGVLGSKVTFVTHGRLSERPMGPLEDELTAHGMDIRHVEDGRILVSGSLSSGVYRLPGTVSSQFITGLLLSLPYLEGNSRVELTSPLKSAAYVDITLSVLADYGIKITEHDGAYDVPGGQTYACLGAQKTYYVEGDWSQAAFWLAAGLIGSAPVLIRGLRSDSVQGDRKIVDVLRGMGGHIEEIRCNDETSSDDSFTGTCYLAKPSSLHGVVTDVSEIPDLAPAIAAASAVAEGQTRLVNAGRLRLKESDRIDSIVRCLDDLGFDASSRPEEIVINGISEDRETRMTGDCGNVVSVETYGDHRIVMMAAVLSIVCPDLMTIIGSSAVSKSYLTFFTEFGKAGFGGNILRE